LVQDEIGTELDPATQALARALQSPSYPSPAGPGPRDGQEAMATSLHQARQALLRGERMAVARALEHLRTRADCPEEEILLLEVDLALLVEDYDRAASLLEDADDGSPPAPERLRSARLALGRHDDAAARELALEVLMEAHGAADRETELGAVLVLVQAEQRLGKGVHAARSAERALGLARESGSAYGIARALTLQGGTHIYQGCYERAKACFHEARAMALEHGLRHDLAAALRGLRCVLAYTHDMEEALAVAEEELSIWRDLGLERWEAAALEGVALIQSYLGRSADSLRTMARARAISQRLSEIPCGPPSTATIWPATSCITTMGLPRARRR